MVVEWPLKFLMVVVTEGTGWVCECVCVCVWSVRRGATRTFRDDYVINQALMGPVPLANEHNGWSMPVLKITGTGLNGFVKRWRIINDAFHSTASSRRSDAIDRMIVFEPNIFRLTFARSRSILSTTVPTKKITHTHQHTHTHTR